MTPAAPTYRFFIGLVARQLSHSCARQSSFGPRIAPSTSATIAWMLSRARDSLQRVVVSGSKNSGA
jgi:hypothetical protein